VLLRFIGLVVPQALEGLGQSFAKNLAAQKGSIIQNAGGVKSKRTISMSSNSTSLAMCPGGGREGRSAGFVRL